MATKYSVNVFANNSWEGIALFNDKVSLNAMIEFCVTQFQNGNSLTIPADDITIVDMDTGEMMWTWSTDYVEDDEDEYYDDEPYDSPYDELNYDPYMGCDFYDCPTVDDFFCDY